MPIYLEAEEPDGTTYRWIIDAVDFDRIVKILGAPETMKV